MDQNEFNKADAEVEKIVNDNHAKFRAVQYQMVRPVKMPNWTETGRIVRRRAQLRRLGNTAFRFLPVIVFLGAASRGLMDAGFAVMMILASFAWGVNYYMRGYRYE